MSNKSGVSPQIVARPKGGGALHGLGEKFSPDLHTGTGNFTVPIALPPGRNGFKVPVPGGPPDAMRYRPRTEGLFARIDHYHDTRNNFWRVRSKDGLVSEYGTPEKLF